MIPNIYPRSLAAGLLSCLALIYALTPEVAFAQTQPPPTVAQTTGPRINAVPTGPVFAPAGGAAGAGTVVAADRPLPTSFPGAYSGSILSLTTSGTAGAYVAFSATTCVSLDLVNNTGVTLEYRRGGAGSTISILSGSSRLLIGLTGQLASDISVRRFDQSATTVTVTAECLGL